MRPSGARNERRRRFVRSPHGRCSSFRPHQDGARSIANLVSGAKQRHGAAAITTSIVGRRVKFSGTTSQGPTLLATSTPRADAPFVQRLVRDGITGRRLVSRTAARPVRADRRGVRLARRRRLRRRADRSAVDAAALRRGKRRRCCMGRYPFHRIQLAAANRFVTRYASSH